MKCLLCDSEFLLVEALKDHYVYQHSIDRNDIYFKDLFSPDTILKRCDFYHVEFENCRRKKNHMFLCHYGYQQIGGSRGNDQLPLNISRRGPITYYSISYAQHKNFYYFFSSEIVEDFLNSVYSKYKPDKKN